MIPADTDNIQKEYDILSSELEKYNPDLAEKSRVLAITKSDLLDDELKKALSRNIPKQIPHIFISSVAQWGLDDLKDILWRELNRETFQDMTKIVHKNMEVNTFEEEDDEGEEDDDENEIDIET
jgi:GTP-binding protein